jgi:hypothetical protein
MQNMKQEVRLCAARSRAATNYPWTPAAAARGKLSAGGPGLSGDSFDETINAVVFLKIVA